MSTSLLFIFVSAAQPDLQQTAVATLQRFARNFYEGVRLLGNVARPDQQPLLSDVARAQVFVGVLDEATETGFAAEELQQARAQGLTCFVYAPQTADLQTRLTTDLRDWLCQEHLPPLLGKIARGQMPRAEAEALVAAIKAPDALGSWKKKLEEQGYQFSPAAKEETGLRWRMRQFSMRAFAFFRRWMSVILGLVAIILLLVYTGNKVPDWFRPRPDSNQLAAASPAVSPAPITSPSLGVSLSPTPEARLSPSPMASLPPTPMASPTLASSVSPTRRSSPVPSPSSKPTPSRLPTPTPRATPTPTPTPTPRIPVRVALEPASLRFSNFGTKPLKLTNSNFEQIVISEVRFINNSGHFAIAQPCKTPTLARGKSCEIIIRYFRIPTTEQQAQATLEILYEDGSKQIVATRARP